MASESENITKDAGKVASISLKRTSTKHEHIIKEVVHPASDLTYVNPRHGVHIVRELPSDSKLANINMSEKVNVLKEENAPGNEMFTKFNHQFDEKYVNRERVGALEMLKALQYLKNPPMEANVQVDESLNVETPEANNLSSHVVPFAMGDSIILQSLGPNISQTPPEVEPKLSTFGENNKSEVAINNEQETVEKTISYNGGEEDYLDYSEYADYYNDPVEDSKDNVILEVIKFRDYPMGDGYVRIPVYVPGLEIVDVPEVPQLWSAREAFMRQVGSKLYMFIPSAILGFLIGLLIWILILACIRTFGAVKKTIARLFPSEKVDELDLKVMYAMSGDGVTWNNRRDDKMAKIHSVNGSLRRSGNCPYRTANVDKLDKLVPEMADYTCLAEQNDEKGEKVRCKEMKDINFQEQIIKSWRVIGPKDEQRSSH